MLEKIPLVNTGVPELNRKLLEYFGNPTEDLIPYHLYQIICFQRDPKNHSSCFLFVEDCISERFFNVPIYCLPDFKEAQ